jgi:hypothetical protein
MKIYNIMGNSNSVPNSVPNCDQIKIDLEKCCLNKKSGEINTSSNTKKSNGCPCIKLKKLYVNNCDNKEELKKLLINC